MITPGVRIEDGQGIHHIGDLGHAPLLREEDLAWLSALARYALNFQIRQRFGGWPLLYAYVPIRERGTQQLTANHEDTSAYSPPQHGRRLQMANA